MKLLDVAVQDEDAAEDVAAFLGVSSFRLEVKASCLVAGHSVIVLGLPHTGTEDVHRALAAAGLRSAHETVEDDACKG